MLWANKNIASIKIQPSSHIQINPSGKPSHFGDRLPEGDKGRNPNSSPLLPQVTDLSPPGNQALTILQVPYVHTI